MSSKLSTEYLARASALRPKRVIAIWMLVLVAAVFAFGAFFEDGVTTEFTFINDPDSKKGETLLEERLTGPDSIREVVIVRSTDLTVGSPEFQERVEAVRGEIASLGPDVVSSTETYFDAQDESLVSNDRRSTIIPVIMAGDLKDAESNIDKVHEILDRNSESSEFQLFITGEATFSQDFTEGAQADAEKGESLGIPVAMIILAVVFGALAAAVLPMILAIVAIAIALGSAALVGQVYELNVFVQNIITMVGLAVGIDYSLFIVSRFREERARGLEKVDAIAAAGATASRAVFFSGMTVILGLVGLLIVPHSVFFSLGLGAIFVVAIAVMASLTLLPAVLGLMGDRVNKFRIPLLNRRKTQSGGQARGFWDRVTYTVMRRPVISLVLAAGLLIAAAIPYFSINTGTSGVSSFPGDFTAKQGFVVLQEEFGFSLNAPAEVVIDGNIGSPAVQQAIQALQTTLATDPNFGEPVLEVNDAGDLALLEVPIVGDATGEQATDAVRRLRADYIPEAFSGVPAEVFVTGTTADDIDFIDLSNRYLPIVLAVVLALSFLLLTAVFRSLVVPIKAIVLNLLSVGAAYGLLVLVFQKGVGNEIFGFPQVDVIQPWIPLFLFAVLFGLSMDYHVFLLSRVRERYLQTGNNSESVAFGLRSTAGLITGAALIMVAVFGGFAAGDLIGPVQFGFGMSVAILLDATIVRSVLVPATMKLLGDRNWYLPRWLNWLPDIQVEGGKRAPVATLSPQAVPAATDE